jgi:CRP-like cAMP-binding protein
MEDSSLLDAPARIAKRLLGLTQSQHKLKVAGTPLQLSQEELARSLGLSRQIVNKHLQTWKRADWIGLGRGTVLVKDAQALRTVCETQ